MLIYSCKVLEENPSTELVELAKLYDLKARICSNLERAYLYIKAPQKAHEYLEEGIENCTTALAVLETPDDKVMQKLKEELLVLQSKLEERNEQYAVVDSSASVTITLNIVRGGDSS